MPARHNFEFDLGEHWPIPVTCHEDQLATDVMDLTGAKAWLRLAGRDGSFELANETDGISFTDADAGEALIVIPPAKQEDLRPGVYTYTLRIQQASGAVSDQLEGTIYVRGTEFTTFADVEGGEGRDPEEEHPDPGGDSPEEITVDGIVFVDKTWDDEFASGVDWDLYKPSYWWHVDEGKYGYLGRTIRDEDEIYANPTLGDPDPFTTIAGDGISITARELTAAEIAAHEWGFWTDRGIRFLSGMLSTEESFTQAYGYFECEARVPIEIAGTFPAFWLCRPGPNPDKLKDELDVMEAIGTEITKYHFTTHWGIKDLTADKQHTGIKPVDMTQFHRFGMVWTPDYIVAVLDGVVREETRQANPGLHTPMMMIVNLAVGGRWPESITGVPNVNDYPATMYVRRIRAWAWPED